MNSDYDKTIDLDLKAHEKYSKKSLFFNLLKRQPFSGKCYDFYFEVSVL